MTFPHPSLYVGYFNCQHVNWGYNKTFPDGESLDFRATSNNLGLLFNPKETPSFFSRRCNVDTNPDLAFASFGQDSRLPDRRVLGNFPWSQHRPSLITPPNSRFLPTAIWWSVGTFPRLIGIAFAFSQMNLLRDCHLRTHQTLRGHTSIFATAHFLRPTMYPTWPSEELCAMLGQKVRDPLSLLQTCWASSHWSHSVSSTPCHGAWTSAPLSAHPSIKCKRTVPQINTPICTCCTSHQFIWQ